MLNRYTDEEGSDKNCKWWKCSRLQLHQPWSWYFIQMSSKSDLYIFSVSHHLVNCPSWDLFLQLLKHYLVCGQWSLDWPTQSRALLPSVLPQKTKRSLKPKWHGICSYSFVILALPPSTVILHSRSMASFNCIQIPTDNLTHCGCSTAVCPWTSFLSLGSAECWTRYSSMQAQPCISSCFEGLKNWVFFGFVFLKQGLCSPDWPATHYAD